MRSPSFEPLTSSWPNWMRREEGRRCQLRSIGAVHCCIPHTCRSKVMPITKREYISQSSAEGQAEFKGNCRPVVWLNLGLAFVRTTQIMCSASQFCTATQAGVPTCGFACYRARSSSSSKGNRRRTGRTRRRRRRRPATRGARASPARSGGRPWGRLLGCRSGSPAARWTNSLRAPPGRSSLPIRTAVPVLSGYRPPPPGWKFAATSRTWLLSAVAARVAIIAGSLGSQVMSLCAYCHLGSHCFQIRIAISFS
jgi:hypothetical protein